MTLTNFIDVRGEHYRVTYTPATAGDALRVLGRWAGDKDLRFTWYDCARMSHDVRASVEVAKLLQCGGR